MDWGLVRCGTAGIDAQLVAKLPLMTALLGSANRCEV